MPTCHDVSRACAPACTMTPPAQVAREIKLHINLNHTSIIAMYAAWKDKQYVYLALEWAPGVRGVTCSLPGGSPDHRGICLSPQKSTEL